MIVTGELVMMRGLFEPEFESTVRMVGSGLFGDTGLVSPSPDRMTDTGVLDPEWGDATLLLLLRGILRGGILN